MMGIPWLYCYMPWMGGEFPIISFFCCFHLLCPIKIPIYRFLSAVRETQEYPSISSILYFFLG